jgi:hypothetical protein
MWTHFLWISSLQWKYNIVLESNVITVKLLVADDENLTSEHKSYQLFIPILEASSVLNDVISIFTSAFSSVLKFESLHFVFYLSYFFNTIIFKISCDLYCILIVIMCCHVCWYFCKKRNDFTNVSITSFPFSIYN